jgi:hypothetical protein
VAWEGKFGFFKKSMKVGFLKNFQGIILLVVWDGVFGEADGFCFFFFG